MKKIQDINLENKKVLLRVDFNVSVEDGKVKEDFKIKACKETLDYILEKKAKVALLSHLGRPEGKRDQKFSLEQIEKDVARILGYEIKFVADCVGDEVKKSLDNLSSNKVLLLENVRFYAGDEENDADFSKKLAESFDIFVNDAFSASHRDHASVSGVAKILPSFAGFQLQKEIAEMEKIKNNFASPAVAIIGGAKIETKLPVIKFFEGIYDAVLVGGKIANEALDQKQEFSDKVILPEDFVDDRLDIGPRTIEKFKEKIANAKTIVWNGPLGKFEEEKYSCGTYEILDAILENKQAYTVLGGGETLEALEKKDAISKISFVSAGGGAMLEYLEGKKMPGIEALEK